METRVIATIAFAIGNMLLTAGGSAAAQDDNTRKSLGEFATGPTSRTSSADPFVNKLVLAAKASSEESVSESRSVDGYAACCDGGNTCDGCSSECEDSLGDEFQAHTPWDIGPLLELCRT